MLKKTRSKNKKAIEDALDFISIRNGTAVQQDIIRYLHELKYSEEEIKEALTSISNMSEREFMKSVDLESPHPNVQKSDG
jgi:SOS response regulatory protein OraA/RecX